MKKIFTPLLSMYIGMTFAQSNMQDGRIVGSFDLGNKQVTAVFNEQTGCTHKTQPHQKGIFVIGEQVKIDMSTNEQHTKIEKQGLPEVVYADKGCSDYPMYEDIDGVLQKRKTPADVQRLASPDDQIVVDMIALDNNHAAHGTTYYAVVPADGSEPYAYWNNPPAPNYMDIYDPNVTQDVQVCGRVWCCEGAYAHNGRVAYCQCDDDSDEECRSRR